MSINPAMSASVNIQANYAVTSSVNTYDTTNVWSGSEDASELQQQEQAGEKQDVGGSKSAQTAAKSAQTQAGAKASETGKSGEASEAGAAAQAEGGQETSEAAERTLRLTMADNSKELQAKFSETQQARNDQPSLSQDVRRQVMLRNMENMVKMQLAQYTGNEPYSKANYREILGAVSNMQGDGKTTKTKEDNSTSSAKEGTEAGKAEEKDGVYKLYSGQAAKTLAALNNPRGGGDDNFDCVA